MTMLSLIKCCAARTAKAATVLPNNQIHTVLIFHDDGNDDVGDHVSHASGGRNVDGDGNEDLDDALPTMVAR